MSTKVSKNKVFIEHLILNIKERYSSFLIKVTPYPRRRYYYVEGKPYILGKNFVRNVQKSRTVFLTSSNVISIRRGIKKKKLYKL